MNAPEPRSARHPQRIGRYRILAPLASGGMATVYLARVSGLGGFEREVALKLLHPHLSDRHEQRAQLLAEARIAARLRHPHAVPVIDVGEESGEVFLVMEYVEGGTLAELVQAVGALPRPIALRILCDTLAGLHAAHELCDSEGRGLGLIHRDVSPHNVLLGADGVSRLSDFGIAKARGSDAHTRPGLVKGKLRYMAPEQAAGRLIDRRVDVWAAGVIAWELFADRPLFDEADEALVVLRLLQETPPPLCEVRDDVPAPLSEVVARALRPKADERHATAEAFREALVKAAGEAALASQAEVGALVRDRLAEPLAERHAMLTTARGTTARHPAAREDTSGVRLAARPARRWRTLGLAGLAATAVAATLALSTVGDEALALAPALAPALRQDPPAAPEAWELEVVANLPMAQIQVGERSIAVMPAASAITVSMRAGRAPPAEGLWVTARSSDGREARALAQSGAASVTLAFDEAPPAASVAPRARLWTRGPAGKPRASGEPPPLPGSPYQSP